MKIKNGDVFHMRCDYPSGGSMVVSEGVVKIIERPHGKVRYQVLKGISRMENGIVYVETVSEFLGGSLGRTIWESTKILKKDHPEYWL